MSGELTPDQLRRHDESLTRAMAEPIPAELRAEIVNLIEPHTMNMYLDHGDTMTCIEVAFPVIRDYLRAHPEPAG
jgi:hypothetical protein